MPSIDERVVEMKFRRDDFLQGTKETIESLNRLEGALADTGNIGGGIDKIASVMSTLSRVATGGLAKLGVMAVDAGAKLVSGVLEPIFSGGKKRALNLEQAAFQLEGIMTMAKEADKVGAISKIMDDVSYAVRGTAYGLDAAAVAASQFAAMGMRGGTEMQQALRGISGVAAMAGSSYEDISSIFTKIAGNGRVMGDDLNRLGLRGINAAKMMADAFGITEEEMRDMVTEGNVSFQFFAKTMDDAFGEHAKKANDTYTGSLSNMRAALARIGALFAAIKLESHRRVFNALSPVFDKVKKSLEPLASAYEKFIAIPFAEKVESWSSSLQNWGGWDGLANVMLRIFEIGIAVRDVFGSWLSPITAAFQAVFMQGDGGWLMGLGDFLFGLRQGIYGLEANADQQVGMTRFFVDVFKALQTGMEWISKAFQWAKPYIDIVWEAIKTGVDQAIVAFQKLRPHIQSAFDFLNQKTAPIRDFFRSFIDASREAGSPFIVLGDLAKNFYAMYIFPIVETMQNLQNIVSNFGTEGFAGLGERLQEAFSPLSGAWEWLKQSVADITGAVDAIKSPTNWLKSQMPTLGDIFSAIFDFFGRRVDAGGHNIEAFFVSMENAFAAIGQALDRFIANADLERLVDFAVQIARLVVAFKALKLVKPLVESMTNAFGAFGGVMDAFKNRIELATKGNAFLKLAIGLAIIAASLWLLTKVPFMKLLGAAVILAALGAGLYAIIKAMSAFPASPTLMATVGAMMSLAIALGLIALTIAVLGSMDIPTLTQGGAAVIGLIATLAIAAVAMGRISSGGLVGMATALLGLAGALTLLIIPINVLGRMPLDVLKQGLISVAIGLGVLAAAAFAMGRVTGGLKGVGINLLMIVGAFTLMLVAIDKLAQIPWDSVKGGLTAVALGMLVMAGAATALSKNTQGPLLVLALAAAFIALAYGLKMLQGITWESVAGGMMAVAIALALLVGASYALTAVLPGALALAGIIVGFGIAALFGGLGALFLAKAFEIVSGALPEFTKNLINLALAIPGVVDKAWMFVGMGLALAVFGAGAIIAGIGAILMGVAFLAFAKSLEIIAKNGPAGAQALLEVVEQLKPLWSSAPKLVAAAAGIGAIGLAMIALGIGLSLVAIAGALVGVMLVILGLGEAVAAAGAGLLAMGLQALIPKLEALGASTKNLSEFSERLIKLADAIMKMGAAVGQNSGAISQFVQDLNPGAWQDAASSIEAATETIGGSIGGLPPAINEAANEVGPAAQQIPDAMTSGITSGAEGLFSEMEGLKGMFGDLGVGIAGFAPEAGAAAAMTPEAMSGGILAGIPGLDGSLDQLTGSFDGMGADIDMSALEASGSTEDMMAQMQAALDGGKGGVEMSANDVTAALQGMPLDISAIAGDSGAAAGTIPSGIMSGLMSGNISGGVQGLLGPIAGVAPGISAQAPAAGAASSSVSNAVVNNISNSGPRVEGALTSIVAQFSRLEGNIRPSGDRVAQTVRGFFAQMLSQVNVAATQLPPALNRVVAAFTALSVRIRAAGTSITAAVRTIMASMRSAISSGAGAAASSAYSAGQQVAAGMRNGIQSGRAGVVAAARSMAAAAAAAARSALVIRSPSRVFQTIGQYLVQGFVRGIVAGEGSVVDSASSLGEKSVEAVRAAFDAITEDLQGLPEFQWTPVVTPILDLDGVSSGASAMQAMFDSASMNATSMEARLAALATIDASSNPESAKAQRSVVYYQYNTSPKALSRAEIYRQTRNQISLLERLPDEEV